MSHECPNGCGRTLRTDSGLAFHLTWCKPAQPVGLSAADAAAAERAIGRESAERDSADAAYAAGQITADERDAWHRSAIIAARNADYSRPMPAGFRVSDPLGALGPDPRAIAYLRPVSFAEPVRPEPIPAIRPAPEPTTPAAGPVVMSPSLRASLTFAAGISRQLPAQRRGRARAAKPAEPRHPRKAAPKSDMPDRIGDAFLIGSGPDRVLVSVATGPDDYRGDAATGARALAAWRKSPPRYRRAPHVETRPTPDPLATTAEPISGWRAPESPYPAIEYVTDPGSYDARRDTCSYPRLEPMHATADERRAARKPRVGRGKGPGSCWCGDHGTTAGDGKGSHLPAYLIAPRASRKAA